MKLTLWSMIIALRADITNLLEHTLHSGGARQSTERDAAPLVDEETLSRLRIDLRSKLDILKDSLHKELPENEAYLMLFPIVLLCDEMVMGKLPKQQHTLWFLLQSELYKINYGGDVFYDFVDERLTKPDTPAMVFEVLYYCLSVGFVGKFDDDGGKVQRYKALLSERIPGAFTPLRKKKRRREAREAEAVALAAPTPVAAAAGSGWGAVAWYYLVTVGLMVLAVGVVLALSNL